jgi:F0F1-type ATP synthase assembly protein I
MKSILGYFDLGLLEEDEAKEPSLGRRKRDKSRKVREREKTIWTLVLYFGVFLGVLGQQFLTKRAGFNPLTLVVSTILGTVVFPQVYRQAKLNARKPNLMQFFIAFQNGFFWQNIMSTLA